LTKVDLAQKLPGVSAIDPGSWPGQKRTVVGQARLESMVAEQAKYGICMGNIWEIYGKDW